MDNVAAEREPALKLPFTEATVKRSSRSIASAKGFPRLTLGR
jgi:hypothetical protein